MTRQRRLGRARAALSVLGRFVGTLGLVLAAGCGDAGSRRPDTDAGAGQPVPATESCTDFCDRAGSCAATLCDEDSMSTRYLGLGDLLTLECDSTCTDTTIQTRIPADKWQCFFQSSCRQVFDYDDCHVGASYTCH